MLQASLERLTNFSAGRLAMAEHLAQTIITVQKQEDLIPANEAMKIADNHRLGKTEEWNRLVLGCAIGLESLDEHSEM